MRTKPFFKEWRKHKGLTQSEVGDALGWDQSKSSKIENDKMALTIEDMEAAADLFGCTLIELLSVNPQTDREIWRFFEDLRSCPPQVQSTVMAASRPIMEMGKLRSTG